MPPDLLLIAAESLGQVVTDGRVLRTCLWIKDDEAIVGVALGEVQLEGRFEGNASTNERLGVV